MQQEPRDIGDDIGEEQEQQEPSDIDDDQDQQTHRRPPWDEHDFRPLSVLMKEINWSLRRGGSVNAIALFKDRRDLPQVQTMVRDLKRGRTVRWSRFHMMQVTPEPEQTEIDRESRSEQARQHKSALRTRNKVTTVDASSVPTSTDETDEDEVT